MGVTYESGIVGFRGLGERFMMMDEETAAHENRTLLSALAQACLHVASEVFHSASPHLRSDLRSLLSLVCNRLEIEKSPH